MARKPLLLTLAAAALAALLGLAASVAVYGPGALLNTRLLKPFAEDLAPALDSATGATPVGAPLPPLRLPLLDGGELALPRPGEAVLINYWASWCGPCIGEMPLLDALHASPAGPRVVGVALEDAAGARGFLAQRPVRFPIALEAPGPRDSSMRLGNHRGVLPFSVLVGADGRVLARHSGAFRDTGELQAWAAAAK